MYKKNMDNFQVSGWSDDEDGIEPERNPAEENSKRILCAAENDDLETVTTLLESESQLVNISDKEGYTPLHRACYGNHSRIVKYLLKHGANVAAKTELQWEPLHSCVQWNSVECAQLLITEGANVNALSEGGQTPLHIAATNSSCYNIIQLLLFHPYIKPYLRNVSNETAFDIAKRRSKYSNLFNMINELLAVNNIELLN